MLAKRATISYDEKSAFALFDRIEAVFTPELIVAKSGGGDASSMPIFVIGMPRSGTTLVEQIIASHPMVHGAGELRNLNDVILTVRGPDGKTIPYPEFVPALDARRRSSRSARGMSSHCGSSCPNDRKIASASPTRCPRTIISPALSTSRCRTRRSSTPCATRRYLRIVFLQAFLRRAKPHLQPRRARPVSQTIPAPDGRIGIACCPPAASSMSAMKGW